MSFLDLTARGVVHQQATAAFQRGHILNQSATLPHVEELQTITNPENRLALRKRLPQQQIIRCFPRPVHLRCFFSALSPVSPGLYISRASWKQDPGGRSSQRRLFFSRSKQRNN